MGFGTVCLPTSKFHVGQIVIGFKALGGGLSRAQISRGYIERG